MNDYCDISNLTYTLYLLVVKCTQCIKCNSHPVTSGTFSMWEFEITQHWAVRYGKRGFEGRTEVKNITHARG